MFSSKIKLKKIEFELHDDCDDISAKVEYFILINEEHSLKGKLDINDELLDECGQKCEVKKMLNISTDESIGIVKLISEKLTEIFDDS